MIHSIGLPSTTSMEDLANSIKNLHKMAYENSGQGQRILDYLNEQRKKQPSSCDSILKISGTEIRGHRCVLAVSFPKLAESLRHKKAKTTIALEGLDPSAVEALVEYSYTSRLDILPEDVGNVYFAAKNLEVKEIEQAAEEFILDYILPLNWQSVRSFGEKNNCRKFIAAADRFIEKNMEAIYRKKDFFQLPRLQVELAATQHSIRDEAFDPTALCNSAISWVQKEIREGDSSLQNLLEQTHIAFIQPDGQLKECKPEDLSAASEVIATDAQKEYIRYNSMEHLAKASMPSDDEGIVENNNERKHSCGLYQGKEFRLIAAIQSADSGYTGMAIMDGTLVAISIFCAAQFSCANSTSSDSSGYDDWALIAPMSRGRCSVGAVVYSDKLFAIGGYDRGDCLQMVECYDPQTNEWMPVGQLSSPRGRFGVATIDNNFYAIGGSDGHKELDTGERYDARLNAWSSIPPMKVCRSSFGMGVIDGCIYAVGGFQGQMNLKSVERYDPSTKEWSRVSPMNTERNNLSVEVLDGKLYAIGGYNGWACFSSVECFDPMTEHWSFIKQMKIPRRGAGCAAIGGRLYVIGGSDGTNFLSSVECYNPETCEWAMVASMNTARHNVGVAVIGDQIYVVGGFDGLSFLNTIECYDPQADKWSTFIHSQ